MPQTKTRTIRAARKTGKAAHRRGRGKKGNDNLRGTVKAGSGNVALVANSLASLKLAPVWGIDVRVAFSGPIQKIYREFDPVKALSDMDRVYANCCTFFKKKNESASITAGLSAERSVYRLFEAIKQMPPFDDENPAKAYEWNIDIIGDTYAPTLIYGCSMDWCWHIIEVKPVLKRIGRYRSIRSLYFNVLYLLAKKADIPTWWNGAFGWAEEYFEWRIIREFDEYCEIHGIDDDEERMDLRKRINQCAQCYESGDAKKAEKEIKASGTYGPQQLLDKVLPCSFPGNLQGLKDWMLMACRFLLLPGALADFMYEMDEEQDGLRLDEQIAIIWEEGDFLTNLHTEYMDAEANGVGVREPVLSHHFLPKQKQFDFMHFNKMREWPRKLDNLIDGHMIMVNNFNNERTDK